MKLKRMSWIELGYAPVPVDIRKNMRSFSLKNPLEYETIMDKYKITVSNQDTMQFSLYAGEDHVLIFNCNLNRKYLYSISFYKNETKITLYSKNGYIFVRPHYQPCSVRCNIVIWQNLLADKMIQKLLGIVRFSDTRIDFLKPEQ